MVGGVSSVLLRMTSYSRYTQDTLRSIEQVIKNIMEEA